MAGITQVTGSTVTHVLAQLSPNSATDRYRAVDVAVIGSGATAELTNIYLTLVSGKFDQPTGVIMAQGSTLVQAMLALAGSYSSETSAIVDVGVAATQSDSGNAGSVVVVALIQQNVLP